MIFVALAFLVAAAGEAIVIYRWKKRSKATLTIQPKKVQDKNENC